jgi:hypothetical protein
MPSQPISINPGIYSKQPCEHSIQKPSFQKKPTVLEALRDLKLPQLNADSLQNFQGKQLALHHERQWHHRQRLDFF